MEHVYVAYLASERDQAEKNGKSRWPCKIGKAKNVAKRIAQLAAAWTAKPIVVAFPVSSGVSAESFLHAEFKRQRYGTGGDEWFLTTPDEVSAALNRFTEPKVLGPKTIGGAIRWHRSLHGLTQTELARLANLRQATISDIERGIGDASFDSVFRIISALGLRLVVVA